MLGLEFSRFLIAGGIAASANFFSRFVFSIFCSYGLAVFLAYLTGMLTAFILMRSRVFNASDANLAPQAAKFVAINLISVLQTLFISLLLAVWLLPKFGVTNNVAAEATGHLIGVLFPVISSYFGHKFFTFR